MSCTFTASGFPPQARSMLQRTSELLQARGGPAAGLSTSILTAVRDGAATPEGHVDGVAGHVTATAPSHHLTARRLGAEPSSCYGAAAAGIELVAADKAGELTIVNGAPIFSHWNKDVIVTPRNGSQWLTIPACPEAYGKRASEFGDRLQFQPRGPSLAVLVLRTRIGPRKAPKSKTAAKAAKARKPTENGTRETAAQPRSENEKVFYWLVKRVVLPADPTLLPSKQDLMRLAVSGARQAVAEVFQSSIPS